MVYSWQRPDISNEELQVLLERRRQELLYILPMKGKFNIYNQEDGLINEWISLLKKRNEVIEQEVKQENSRRLMYQLGALRNLLTEIGHFDLSDLPTSLHQGVCRMHSDLREYFEHTNLTANVGDTITGDIDKINHSECMSSGNSKKSNFQTPKLRLDSVDNFQQENYHTLKTDPANKYHVRQTPQIIPPCTKYQEDTDVTSDTLGRLQGTFPEGISPICSSDFQFAFPLSTPFISDSCDGQLAVKTSTPRLLATHSSRDSGYSEPRTTYSKPKLDRMDEHMCANKKRILDLNNSGVLLIFALYRKATDTHRYLSYNRRYSRQSYSSMCN